MARSFQIHQAILANSTTPDVIASAGINAFFGKAASITVYWNCDTVATMTAQLTSDDGSTATGLVPAGSAVPVASTAGKTKANEDFVGQFPIDAGSKLLMSVNNPTGGNLNFNATVIVN